MGALNRLSDYRVIWAFNGVNKPPIMSHVKLVGWVPQLDVLAHPRTKIFVTHGGLKRYGYVVAYRIRRRRDVLGLDMWELNIEKTR